MPKSGTGEKAGRAAAEPFFYPQVEAALPARAPAGSGAAAAGAVPAQVIWANSQPGAAARADRYGEEEFQARLQAREKEARERGAQEAEARLRSQCEAAVMAERHQVAQALADFHRERKTYFQRVEGEVIQLSLAIARKILHREAQVDPLFLAGVVRVALGKVAASSAVKLRVPEAEIFQWRQIAATLKDVQPQPEVIGDPAQPAGRCVMETEVGSTNISLESQFREIERGLLDLMALRPASEEPQHRDAETPSKDERNENQTAVTS